jgi:hypothetical protein
VETLNQRRHYLEGTNFKILLQCNHNNLEYFQTSEVLYRKDAWWSEILLAYDFAVENLEGSKHPADSPCTRPNYRISFGMPVA